MNGRTKRALLLTGGAVFVSLLLCCLAPTPGAWRVPRAPQIYCTTLYQHGMLLASRGKFEQSIRRFEAALECARAFDDRLSEEGCLANIGRQYVYQQRYGEAEKYFAQAERILPELGSRARECSLWNSIGRLEAQLGDMPAAREQFDKALPACQAAGDLTHVSVVYHNIGFVYHFQGDYAKAISYYERALDAYQEAPSARRSRGWNPAAASLNNTAMIYGAQQRIPQALQTLERAIETARQTKSDVQECMALLNLGNRYLNLDPAQARAYYERALQLAARIKNGELERVVLQNLGYLELREERYDAARERLQQAKAIAEKLGASSLWHDYALANVTHTENRYAEALVLYERVREQAEREDDHEMSVMVLLTIGNLAREQEQLSRALALYGQGLDLARDLYGGEYTPLFWLAIAEVYEAQGDAPAALQAYERVLTRLDESLSPVGSVQQKSTLHGGVAWVYEAMARLLYQDGQSREAFWVAERGRARAFLESMSVQQEILDAGPESLRTASTVPGTARIADRLPDEEQSRLLLSELSTYLEWQKLLQVLRAARDAERPEATLADIQARVEAAEGAHRQALTEIRAYGGPLATLVPGQSTALDVSGVQALLDDQTTVLSYLVLEEQTLAFVITRDRFSVVEIGVSRGQLEQDVAATMDLVGDRNTTLEHVQPWQRGLYQTLVAPVASLIQTPRLIVVPHGRLHDLSFAALQNPDTGQHLIEEHALVYLPSASVLSHLEDTGDRSPGVALIVGDPDLGDQTGLAGTRRAALEIAALYDVDPLTGERATESAVRDRCAQATTVHLGTHADWVRGRPFESYIALLDHTANDGRLSVDEVYGLDLGRSELVVLHACQTQAGAFHPGDEIVSMTRAFFFAGAPSVVATLWQVDDEASAELMIGFHTYLQGGLDRAEALRQAQIDVSRRYSAPYYWAGFVLSGDGGS